MTDETSPATRLRADVVLMVVRTIRVLALGMWAGIFALLGYGRSIPGELWLAAGASSGSLTTLLVNTKHDDPPPDAGHAELHGVIALAVGIALGLIVWSVIGAHTDLY